MVRKSTEREQNTRNKGSRSTATQTGASRLHSDPERRPDGKDRQVGGQGEMLTFPKAPFPTTR